MDRSAALACSVALAVLSGCARETPPSVSNERLAYLSDRQDIVDTLQRYIRGIDRHDKDLVRSTFWPEARINLGTPRNLEEYVQQEEAALAAYAAHQHHVTGQTIDIEGNTAHVESYVFFLAVPRDTGKDTPGETTTPGRALTSGDTQLGSGRYIERWEKRNGEWRILVREYAHDLNVFGKTDDYCGRRPCLTRWDKGDISYKKPLEAMTPEQRRALAESNEQRHTAKPN